MHSSFKIIFSLDLSAKYSTFKVLYNEGTLRQNHLLTHCL